MTDTTALKALLDKVEAGEWNPYATPATEALAVELILNAYSGSLDAAKALHEKVLHERVVKKEVWSKRYGGTVELLDRLTIIGVGHSNDNPARAWLIAILKAMIAEGESK